jgi:aspartyl-tRNA(Asn)/glutamyl-tRNA(Gln) amidotransferase subunit B
VWQQTGKKLGEVPKTTRGWDEAAQITREQRSKEESSDYRYFPDPDLLPVITTEAEVEAIRASLGELPAAIRRRLETSFGITPYDSDVIVNQGRATVDYFAEVAERTGDGKTASNWIQQDVLRSMNERQIGIERFPIAAKDLAALLAEVKAGKLETSRAREVFQVMLDGGKTAAEAIKFLGIEQVDDSALIALCRELLAANPKIAAEAKAGQSKGIGQLIGQAKKKNPNVNPNRVKEICLELIAKE